MSYCHSIGKRSGDGVNFFGVTIKQILCFIVNYATNKIHGQPLSTDSEHLSHDLFYVWITATSRRYPREENPIKLLYKSSFFKIPHFKSGLWINKLCNFYQFWIYINSKVLRSNFFIFQISIQVAESAPYV